MGINITSLDQAFDDFRNLFLHHFNTHFPLKPFYVSRNEQKNWVTDEVKISSIKLKDLFILKNAYNELTETYNLAKNRHNQLVKSTKRLHYQNKILNSSNPAKTAWKVISELTRTTSYSNNIKYYMMNT